MLSKLLFRYFRQSILNLMWIPNFIRCILCRAGNALQGFPSLLKLKLSGWTQYLELKSSSLKSLTAIHSIDSGNVTFQSPKDLPQLRTVNLSICTGYAQRDADNYKCGLRSHEVQQKRTVCFLCLQRYAFILFVEIHFKGRLFQLLHNCLENSAGQTK